MEPVARFTVKKRINDIQNAASSCLATCFPRWYSHGAGEPDNFFMRDFKKGYLQFSLGPSAGVMIFISFDELLPLSCEGKGYHRSILGVLIGMLIIALSIYLFNI